MAVNVKLSEFLINQAKHHALVQHRSVPKQIEYWSQIGKMAEENPDLPFSVIRDILVADQEQLQRRADRRSKNELEAGLIGHDVQGRGDPQALPGDYAVLTVTAPAFRIVEPARQVTTRP